MFFKEKFNENNLYYPVRYPDRLGSDLAIGCGYTYGVGVEDQQDWPSILGLYNLGQEGVSNDFIVRLAIQYINRFPKIQNVYVLWTHYSRREYVDDSKKIIPYFPEAVTDSHYKSYEWLNSMKVISTVANDRYNYEKNKVMMELACRRHNIRLHQISVEETQHWVGPRSSNEFYPDYSWHLKVATMFKNISITGVQH